ncbi:homoserine kinase [Paenibacillus sp. 1001270B_150601_E10]|uniref:homoserine kinase n=1 Tax=Paenibacillus sp. 1001270B_150601_E10 TaxID=2787079 RepID=UPI00189CFE57|nr:homoserine kinase [Paenibacillus sp. 1001270B_150601_E10]
MIREDGVLVRVPASTANLGPGFDTLGLALSLHLWIGMKPAEKTVVHMYGDHLGGLPNNEDNLIVKVAYRLFREAGQEIVPLQVDVYSEIPLTRGLGSSATAIIGALFAANELLGEPLSKQQLFDMATNMEKHPDNVGASLYGGLLVAAWDGMQAHGLSLMPDPSLTTVVAVPRFHLETKKARSVLPERYELKDVVFNVSRSSLLAAALATGQYDQLSIAMQDRVHQPYRAPLVPGMEEVLQEAVHHGALGAALSGAGPTVIALAKREEASVHALIAFMKETLSRHGVEADVFQLDPCNEGAVRLEGQASDIHTHIPVSSS